MVLDFPCNLPVLSIGLALVRPWEVGALMGPREESRKEDWLCGIRPKSFVETEQQRQGLAAEDTQPSNYWEKSNSDSQPYHIPAINLLETGRGSLPLQAPLPSPLYKLAG